MRQPPKAGPSAVSWIAISAPQAAGRILREQQRLMAVVVGVTEHLSPCRRRAADKGSFSNLGGPTQVAESSCRAQSHIRVLGRRYHRLGYTSHTTRASRSGFSNCRIVRSV